MSAPAPEMSAPVPDRFDERDAGLAVERTELAWTRTGISFAALGTVMLRTSPVAAALVLAIAVGVWGLGQLSARRLRHASGRRADAGSIAGLVTAVTSGTAVLALVVVLLDDGLVLG